MEDTLEELDEVFSQARSKMFRKEDENKYNADKELENIIRILQDNVINELSRYNFSNRVYGNIEDTLTELRFMLRNSNNKKTEELVNTAVQYLKRTQSVIEEERSEKDVPSEERRDVEKREFNRTDQMLDEEYQDANRNSNYDRIEDFVTEAKRNILRNIISYIEFEGVVALNLRAQDIEKMREAIDTTFMQATNDLQQLYGDNIKAVQDIIVGEVGQVKDFAEQQLEESERKSKQEESKVAKSENRSKFEDLFLEDRPKASQEQSREERLAKLAALFKSDTPKKEDSKPWDLENYGTSREEVGEKIAKVTEETIANQDKDDDNKPRTLPDDIII